MEYKNKKSYRFGKLLVCIALALMIVTFALMGFGKDDAIIWFFFGCFIFVIGSFIMTSVKIKYESTCDGEPPFATRVKFYILDTIKVFLKRGKIRAGLLIVLAVITVFSSVEIVKTFNVFYDRGGAYNIGYKQNLKKALEFDNLALEAQKSGDDTYANYCLTMAEKYRDDSGAYLEVSEQLTEKLQIQKKQTVKAIAVNIVFSAIYIGYVIYTKKQTKSKGALSE